MQLRRKPSEIEKWIEPAQVVDCFTQYDEVIWPVIYELGLYDISCSKTNLIDISKSLSGLRDRRRRYVYCNDMISKAHEPGRECTSSTPDLQYFAVTLAL